MRGELRWRSVRSGWFSALLPGGGPEWTGAGASVLMGERELEHLPLGDRSLGSNAGGSRPAWRPGVRPSPSGHWLVAVVGLIAALEAKGGVGAIEEERGQGRIAQVPAGVQ